MNRGLQYHTKVQGDTQSATPSSGLVRNRSSAPLGITPGSYGVHGTEFCLQLAFMGGHSRPASRFGSPSASVSGRLHNRPPYLLRRPANLLGRNHRRRRNQQVVARDAVHASLHGIDQQPAPETCLAHKPGEILLRREGSLLLLVSNELNAPQQAQAADIANRIQIARRFRLPETASAPKVAP